MLKPPRPLFRLSLARFTPPSPPLAGIMILRMQRRTLRPYPTTGTRRSRRISHPFPIPISAHHTPRSRSCSRSRRPIPTNIPTRHPLALVRTMRCMRSPPPPLRRTSNRTPTPTTPSNNTNHTPRRAPRSRPQHTPTIPCLQSRPRLPQAHLLHLMQHPPLFFIQPHLLFRAVLPPLYPRQHFTPLSVPFIHFPAFLLRPRALGVHSQKHFQQSGDARIVLGVAHRVAAGWTGEDFVLFGRRRRRERRGLGAVGL